MSAGLVEVTRQDQRTGRAVVESSHAGWFVVTGPDGVVVAALGDPGHVTFLRSTVKPFQAAACLEALGEVARELTTEEIAIACASHRAEPRHLEVVDRLLGRSGLRGEQLTCPPDVGPADPSAEAERRRHNCSGKHALFALAGAAVGTSREDLLDPSSPLQTRVLDRLEQELGPPMVVARDGCGAPAVAVPLEHLAAAYGRLATEERSTRVREAMLAHPLLVGGEERAETALLASGVLAKPGAEGVMAAGWVGRAGGYGLAIKVADGASRGAATAAVGLLESAGIVPPGTWVSPPPTGGEMPVGEVRVTDAVRGLGELLS